MPTTILAPIGGLAALLLAMCCQGSRGLWDPDEGRYAAVALEMPRLGDFIHPMLQREHPHYTKPPLTYWVIAANVRLFGRNEWAVRLPYALAFAFTGLLPLLATTVFLLVRREWAWMPRVFSPWGLLLFTLVGLSWYPVLVVLLGLRGYASVMPYKKDARAFAEAIASIAPGPYRELIFLDREPRPC